VNEPLIETLVDFPVEPTIEPYLTCIFLRSPDVYDPLKIFLQEIGSPDIGALVCELIFSGAELPSYAARVLFELSPTSVVCHESQFHLHHLGSARMHQC